MARTAEVKRDARIGEAEAKRETTIKEAMAEEERMAAKYYHFYIIIKYLCISSLLNYKNIIQ